MLEKLINLISGLKNKHSAHALATGLASRRKTCFAIGLWMFILLLGLGVMQFHAYRKPLASPKGRIYSGIQVEGLASSSLFVEDGRGEPWSTLIHVYVLANGWKPAPVYSRIRSFGGRKWEPDAWTEFLAEFNEFFPIKNTDPSAFFDRLGVKKASFGRYAIKGSDFSKDDGIRIYYAEETRTFVIIQMAQSGRFLPSIQIIPEVRSVRHGPCGNGPAGMKKPEA
jgi:hypothetical protein